jgi:hypothetical protein
MPGQIDAHTVRIPNVREVLAILEQLCEERVKLAGFTWVSSTMSQRFQISIRFTPCLILSVAADVLDRV